MTWARTNFNYAVGSGSAGEATPFHSKKKTNRKLRTRSNPLKLKRLLSNQSVLRRLSRNSGKKGNRLDHHHCHRFAPFEKRLIKIWEWIWRNFKTDLSRERLGEGAAAPVTNCVQFSKIWAQHTALAHNLSFLLCFRCNLEHHGCWKLTRREIDVKIKSKYNGGLTFFLLTLQTLHIIVNHIWYFANSNMWRT